MTDKFAKLTEFDIQVITAMQMRPDQFNLGPSWLTHTDLGGFRIYRIGAQSSTDVYDNHTNYRSDTRAANYRELSFRGGLQVKKLHREMLSAPVPLRVKPEPSISGLAVSAGGTAVTSAAARRQLAPTPGSVEDYMHHVRMATEQACATFANAPYSTELQQMMQSLAAKAEK